MFVNDNKIKTTWVIYKMTKPICQSRSCLIASHMSAAVLRALRITVKLPIAHVLTLFLKKNKKTVGIRYKIR